MIKPNTKLRRKLLELVNDKRIENKEEKVTQDFINKLINGKRTSAIFDSVVSNLNEDDKALLTTIRSGKQDEKSVTTVTTVNELDYYKGSSFITIHQDVESVYEFVVARLTVDSNYNVSYDSPANMGLFDYSGPITKEGDHIYINFTEQNKKIEKFNIFFKEPFHKNNNYIIHACSTFLSTEKLNINHVMAPMILIKDYSDLDLGAGIFDENKIELTFCKKPSEPSEKHSESIFSFFRESGYPIIIKPYSPF